MVSIGVTDDSRTRIVVYIDLNLLLALGGLLQDRNVTRAGKRLSVTQPTMRCAAPLRPLFDDESWFPTGRTMQLTPLAETLALPVGEIFPDRTDHGCDPILRPPNRQSDVQTRRDRLRAARAHPPNPAGAHPERARYPPTVRTTGFTGYPSLLQRRSLPGSGAHRRARGARVPG